MKLKFAMLLTVLCCAYVPDARLYSNPPGIPLGIVDSSITTHLPGNQLMVGTGHELEERFRGMLVQAVQGEQTFRILHIGDSHIQADFFTGEVRRLMAWWLSDTLAGRGMVFPYALAGTTNPRDYRVVPGGRWDSRRVTKTTIPENFGVTGIALQTLEPGSSLRFELTGSGTSPRPFNRVGLYFEGTGATVTNAQMLKTDGSYSLFQLSDAGCSFEMVYTGNNGSEGLKLFGAEMYHSRSKLVYHSVGANGASSHSFLQSLNFQQHLQLVSPNLVIVSLGTNDAFSNAFSAETFLKNYSMLVDTISRALPGSIIVLTTPNDHYLRRSKPNENIERVRQQIVKIGATYGCAVWDFYSLMGGRGSMALWLKNGLAAPDMLHLSEKGYTLKGELLFRALVGVSGFSPDEPLLNQIPLQLGAH